MSNHNGTATSMALDVNNGVELPGQRFHQTCTETQVLGVKDNRRAPDAVVGNRQRQSESETL